MPELRLKHITRLQYGDALPLDQRRPGDVPVYGSGGVTGVHDAANTRAPAIVVGRKGSYGTVHWTDREAHVIDTAYFVDSRHARCDLRWLYYALQALDLRGPSQDVGVPGLSRELTHELPLPYLPEAAEQRRIAAYLDDHVRRIDAVAEERRTGRSYLLERRRAVIHAAVTGAHGGSSGEADGRLPWAPVLNTAWPVTKLTRVARLGSGHTPSRSRPDWWADCTIPWITTGEVRQVRDDRREVITDTRECISELGLANSAAELHPRGTVVLCRTAASAGYSGVMGLDMATSQDFATWTCGPRLDPFYLLYCLRAMRPYLLGYLAQGSTHKTIYMPDIESLRVPLPPIDEQRAIVGRIRQAVGRIDELVDAVDQQLRLLEERRGALITAAVTGQIDLTGKAA
ncbi:restriction endonuclease subunit S [Geodermatophilus sp. SYSU D00705]